MGLVSVACVIGTLWNAIRVQRNKAVTAEAYSNLRSLSLALMEFDHEYGRFPNAETISMVRERTQSATPMGTKTANDFLRQLLASEINGSEVNTYAAINGTHKPDHDTTGGNALAKGECGFSYVAGLSSKDDAMCPLIVTPLLPGTNRFDLKPFNGNAVVLNIGGDVRILPINAKGEVIDSSGKHILDPANPIWGGNPPVVAWPDL